MEHEPCRIIDEIIERKIHSEGMKIFWRTVLPPDPRIRSVTAVAMEKHEHKPR
jgi:hypothetical protein